MVSPAGQTQFTLRLRGVELAFTDRAQGPPVLLVHGFGQNSYAWRGIVDALPGRRVLTVDLKGFGQSDKPRDGLYSAEDQARLILELISDLDLRDLTLAGHSFGGGVCLQVAADLCADQPECLRGLVLVDSAALPQRLPYFLWLLRPRGLGEALVHLAPLRLAASVALRLACRQPFAYAPESASAYASTVALPGGREAMLATARQMVPRDVESLTARYAAITVPTLLIWGRQDPIVPLNVGQRLVDCLPSARLHVLDSCGHCPHEEHPEQTAGLINEFLAQINPTHTQAQSPGP